MKKPVEIEDLARFVFVSNADISPDGEHIAFTVTKIDLEADDYKSNIWIINRRTEELRSLTTGPKDSIPRWSPDGKHILFTSARTFKPGERGGELWIIPKEGGEPRLVVKMKGGVEDPRWSPDGRHVIFRSWVGKEEKDVKVIRRIPFWFNGVGFIHTLRKHLFIVDVMSGEVEQLTKGEIDVTHAAFSHKGDRIAYIAKTSDMKPMVRDLFILDLKSGEVVKLTESNMWMDYVSWSPDDKYIIFRGNDLKYGFSTHNHVWMIPSEGGEVEDLIKDLDRNIENALNSDVRVRSLNNGPEWHGDYVYFLVADGANVHLYRLNMKTGEREVVVGGDRSVEGFSIAKDIVAFISMTDTELCEVWVKDERGVRKLTDFNGPILKRLKIVKPEKFTFKASDGVPIEGWIMKPADFEEGKKYPAILEIHGGPMTAYGHAFMHEFQLLASKGYVVIYTNPRGSDGYSQEFKDIRRKYGDRDYQDLMEAVDYVVSHYDFIDPNRIGVIGGSYGGFMVNWIVGHTDRFKAAITCRSICNWISDFGTTDIGYYFNPDQIGGTPWDNEEEYLKRSPIRYAKNVKTPLLIIHSIEDYRCWLDQALQMFTALKFLGKEVELVLFPGENHDLSRTGKPKHRVERLRHIVRWFDKHLKGD
ncbi:MAG: S9 family peptidase [Thermoprotei archaeon]|nr:MAG: S9 family peptidase [Thermoprotei archaeon]RLF25568.1 MAG: S9 family peptidase [Thermoprotei archaeon]